MMLIDGFASGEGGVKHVAAEMPLARLGLDYGAGLGTKFRTVNIRRAELTLHQTGDERSISFRNSLGAAINSITSRRLCICTTEQYQGDSWPASLTR